MKKAEKHRILSEVKILSQGLSPEQLAVIRKLIAPSTQIVSVYSRRTVEAILQGRRRDGDTLRNALVIARQELARCNKVMEEIETLISR